MREVKIVFGNHTGGAAHVEDVLTTLFGAFQQLGVPVELEKRPIPGRLNVVLESFGSRFTSEVEAMGAEANLVIVATEFVTSNTFNDFQARAELPLSSRLREGVLRARHRRAKRGGVELPEAASHHYYRKRRVWQRRFDRFLRLARIARAIWCLSPHQMDAYRRVTRRENVHCLRFGFLESPRPLVHRPDAAKDLDFLFTGTMTPHRASLLDALRKRQHRVAWLPTQTPSSIREEHLARARICLNLKQFANWEHPSVTRFHHHLVNRSLLITEPTRYDCELSRYVLTPGSGDFVDFCDEVHAQGGYTQRAAEARDRYAAETSLPANLAQLIRESLPEEKP
jgi:hypothetical protein